MRLNTHMLHRAGWVAGWPEHCSCPHSCLCVLLRPPSLRLLNFGAGCRGRQHYSGSGDMPQAHGVLSVHVGSLKRPRSPSTAMTPHGKENSARDILSSQSLRKEAPPAPSAAPSTLVGSQDTVEGSFLRTMACHCPGKQPGKVCLLSCTAPICPLAAPICPLAAPITSPQHRYGKQVSTARLNRVRKDGPNKNRWHEGSVLPPVVLIPIVPGYSGGARGGRSMGVVASSTGQTKTSPSAPMERPECCGACMSVLAMFGAHQCLSAGVCSSQGALMEGAASCCLIACGITCCVHGSV